MWGAVIGDIAGSRFEGSRGGPKSFELFHQDCRYTDDTVCTAAVADIIVNDQKPDSTLQAWCRRHPGRGYGGHFRWWIASSAPTPYGSFGNGAAMRVAPVAFLYRQRSLEEALATSDRVTEITHDHPEGMKGARAVTEAIWLALQGEGPEDAATGNHDALRLRPRATSGGDPPIPSLRCDMPRHGADSAHLRARSDKPRGRRPQCSVARRRRRHARSYRRGGGRGAVRTARTTRADCQSTLPRSCGGHDSRAGRALRACSGRRDAKIRPAAVPRDVRSRAQGCLLGQLAGDSLGSLVEFKDANTIRTLYPNGVRELSALADTALIHGRCRALALLDTRRPRALRASGQARSCV